MTAREWYAWAAGFIDGEGCISLQRSSVTSGQGWRPMCLKLSVSQKSRDPLDALAGIFGGNVRPMGKYWQWSIVSTQAADALRRMLPFLIVKHDQAELGLEYQSIVKPRGSQILTADERLVREFCYAEMKALKVGT